MPNAFYAQSGGVTAMINTSASALINAARESNDINTVYAGENGILGALNEALLDTTILSTQALKQLSQTPGGAFGSCRYKLPEPTHSPKLYDRLFAVFAAHDIQYFFYNGGNDSQDTTHKVWQAAQQRNYPLCCIGLPKTIDNDLAGTDTCPGYGSVAKYVATATLEASLDVRAMAKTSTQVFILEVMGRHTGWIAAASSLAATDMLNVPHLILVPEVPFNPTDFLNAVKNTVQREGFCVIVASEGIQDEHGKRIAETKQRDAFGHSQLNGVASYLSQRTQQQGHFKTHYAISDYLQRSARHCGSACDFAQAYAMGEAAITLATQGHSGIMLGIERQKDTPYQWKITPIPLDQVANIERTLPKHFIAENKMHVTNACREYLRPYIQGEAYPDYKNGLPDYGCWSLPYAPKKCPDFRLDSVS